MVTPEHRQTKLLLAACFAVVLVLGLGMTVAMGQEAPADEQRPINIDVRDMAIGDVLRMLGQAADVNIIVSQGVVGDIQSLTLRNVSVETALRLITEAHGYYWRVDDGVYVVSAEAPAEPGPTALAPAPRAPEGPAGQPPESTPGSQVPAPPRDVTPPPGVTVPPVAPPQIISELLPLSFANAGDVAAWFGGTTASAGTGLTSRGTMSAHPERYTSPDIGGSMGVRTRGGGLPQFEDVGGVGGGNLGGGFGNLGTTGTTTTGTTTGTTGGTITLPGNMEAPLAIMSQNALLVRGTREEIDEFREMLQLLDVASKQVEIATKWIDVSTTASRALGIDWAVTNGALEIFNLGFAPGEAVNNGIRYGKTRWWAELAVLENNSMATVINEPRVTCMNGMWGTIAFETEIPYFAATISFNQFGQRTVDYTSDFVTVSNELSVLPQINPDDSVQMYLAPQLEDQVGTVEGPNGERIPIITTQFVETMVRVMDGETIVLGGVIRKDESINLRRTPLLADIPIIGKLFQSRRTETTDTELLVFVTPKIVRDMATE